MRLDTVKLQEYLQQGHFESPRKREQKRSSSTLMSFRPSRKLLYIFAILFLLGMTAGTVLVGQASGETRQALGAVLGGYLEKRQVQTFWPIVFSSFSSAAIALLGLFFCGFCSISQVFILGIPFFKGLGYGFSIAAFYIENGIHGIPFVLFILLPGILLHMLLMFYACKTSFLLSVRLLRGSITPPEQSEQYRLQRYCVKYAIYTGICMLISMIDAVIFYSLSALFVL